MSSIIIFCKLNSIPLIDYILQELINLFKNADCLVEIKKNSINSIFYAAIDILTTIIQI